MNLKQNWQYTYNVISKRVRITIVAVKKQLVLHILSVCLKAYVPNMHSACTVL